MAVPGPPFRGRGTASQQLDTDPLGLAFAEGKVQSLVDDLYRVAERSHPENTELGPPDKSEVHKAPPDERRGLHGDDFGTVADLKFGKFHVGRYGNWWHIIGININKAQRRQKVSRPRNEGYLRGASLPIPHP
jgi:hypothetical protein